MTTIVGMFDDLSSAERARIDVMALGINEANINVLAATDEYTGTSKQNKPGFLDRSLGVGVPDEDAGLYAEWIRRGSCTMTIKADESMADEAVSILCRDGAVDVNRHPAPRTADQADMNAFQVGELEVTERSEKSVASKEERAVEEVVVSKRTTDETQILPQNSGQASSSEEVLLFILDWHWREKPK